MFKKKIWLAGGHDDDDNVLSSVEVYDAATNRWERAPDMIEGRTLFNLVVVEDELYAVGGAVETYLSIEKLSKVSGAWQVIAAIEENRIGCSAAAMGSKIYVFGGGRERDAHISTWSAFDVTTEQWASASIPAEKRKLSSRSEFYCGQAIMVPSSLDNGKRMTWYD